MIIENRTPFSSFYFENVDVDDHLFGIVIVKASFDLTADGPLEPSGEQPPVLLEDLVAKGDSGPITLRESELVPYKPRCDVLVVGSARPPRPRRQWVAEIRLGALRHRMRLHGPRRWRRSGSSWSLDDPEELNSVALHHGNAHGGTRTHDGEVHASRHNPTGLGYLPRNLSSGFDEFSAAAIEDPERPARSPWDDLPSPAPGPIGRHWDQRIVHGGTYDEEWLEQRWPLVPRDFDWSFYNCAPESLQLAAHARGDEEFLLSGLLPEGDLRGRLPSLGIGGVAVRGADRGLYLPFNLDTVLFDLEDRRLELSFRATSYDLPLADHLQLRGLGSGCANQETTHGLV